MSTIRNKNKKIKELENKLKTALLQLSVRREEVKKLTEENEQLSKANLEKWDELQKLHVEMNTPIPIVLFCPLCHNRHIDEGEFATKSHATHACQYCGHCWRPAIHNTVGVWFLPGFKNELAK
jgi:DNA repair exonuclease SbcCD ATPase subunit